MPAVVTTSTTVSCMHSGKVTMVGVPKLTVGGTPVLVEAGIAGKPIVGCLTVSNSGPPASVQCTTVVTLTPPTALATKLFVSGQAVVLTSLSGTTNGVVAGTPQTVLSATGAQTLLNSI